MPRLIAPLMVMLIGIGSLPAFAEDADRGRTQDLQASAYQVPKAHFVSPSEASAVETSTHVAVSTASKSRGNFPPLVTASSESDGLAGSSNGASLDGKLPGSDGVMGPLVTTGCALMVVLAVFGIFVWGSRRFGSAPPASGALPEDVLQTLGSATIDGKMRVTFLKIGERILVLGQSPNGEPQTLAEIVDPDEVSRIESRCAGRPQIVGKRSPLSSRSHAVENQAGYHRADPTAAGSRGYQDGMRRDLASG